MRIIIIINYCNLYTCGMWLKSLYVYVHYYYIIINFYNQCIQET